MLDPEVARARERSRQEAECGDTDDNCYAWSVLNECQKNQRFMIRRCRKSCKACHGANSQARAPIHELIGSFGLVWMLRQAVEASTELERKCEAVTNHYAACAVWASGHGRDEVCSKGNSHGNATWMLEHCEKSCGPCRAVSKKLPPPPPPLTERQKRDVSAPCFAWVALTPDTLIDSAVGSRSRCNYFGKPR